MTQFYIKNFLWLENNVVPDFRAYCWATPAGSTRGILLCDTAVGHPADDDESSAACNYSLSLLYTTFSSLIGFRPDLVSI